jgi:tRNA(Ile)-lysidine synthase
MPHDIIFKNVIDFFDTHIPPAPQGKSICAAVSGGCDSVALFYALFALRDRLGITRLGIAHVNHRLRGAESDADAAFVKEMGVKAIVPFHEKILGPRPPRGGMEEWARAERYGFFRNLCTAEGYDYIATGHTADDQAETVFMRIMRGSGLKGLCAIAPVREDHVIRPLLNINRASLCAWLKEKDNHVRPNSCKGLPVKRLQLGDCFHTTSINGVPHT